MAVKVKVIIVGNSFDDTPCASGCQIDIPEYDGFFIDTFTLDEFTKKACVDKLKEVYEISFKVSRDYVGGDGQTFAFHKEWKDRDPAPYTVMFVKQQHVAAKKG